MTGGRIIPQAMRRSWPAIADRLVDLFFHDQARLVEWMSLLALSGFFTEFATNPGILERPGFAGFALLGAGGWLIVTAMGIVAHIFALFYRRGRSPDMRFLAVTLAFGFWVTVTVSFMSTDISSTAQRTYGALAFVTLAAGVFLAWTSTLKR